MVSGPESIISHSAKERNLQPGGLATAIIQALQPETSYSVYAYAMNEVGRSENSMTASFVTCKTSKCNIKLCLSTLILILCTPKNNLVLRVT